MDRMRLQGVRNGIGERKALNRDGMEGSEVVMDRE